MNKSIYDMTPKELIVQLNFADSTVREIRRLLLKHIKDNIRKTLTRPDKIKKAIEKIDKGKSGQFTNKQIIELVNFIKEKERF